MSQWPPNRSKALDYSHVDVLLIYQFLNPTLENSVENTTAGTQLMVKDDGGFLILISSISIAYNICKYYFKNYIRILKSSIIICTTIITFISNFRSKKDNGEWLMPYSVTKGIELIRELTDDGQIIFTIDDAQKKARSFGISRGHLRKILHNLVDGRWIKRIRRGLYAMAMEPLGPVIIHSFAIATHLVQPSAISHWSALSFHNLTDQVPLIVTAITPKKIVTPSMRSSDTRSKTKHTWKLDQTQYEYISTKLSLYFGLESVWIDEHFRIQITDKERTIIDCFATPQMFGGMQWVLSTLEESLDQLNLKKLISYAQRYGRVSIIRRLGWALDKMGVPESIVSTLHHSQVGYSPLDPSRVKRGACDSNWRIIDNIGRQVIS